ncbi:hypothetical protein [Psychrobacillus sp. NPDC096623]|uniref:hypothetical protein n=1 Tax=Psychrobacillus sp. NPDC096623 TaxID=3364492 RepID=UPI00382999DD
MKIRTSLSILGLILLLLTSCSNPTTTQRDESTKVVETEKNFKVVATEESFPTNFDELSFKREETPHYQYLVQIVKSEDTLEELISLQNELPSADNEEEDILLISYEESGSCPQEIENIEYDNKGNLNLTLKNSGSICTSDASPRTNIIFLDKKISQSLTHATIHEGKTTTKVPIQK